MEQATLPRATQSSCLLQNDVGDFALLLPKLCVLLSLSLVSKAFHDLGLVSSLQAPPSASPFLPSHSFHLQTFAHNILYWSALILQGHLFQEAFLGLLRHSYHPPCGSHSPSHDVFFVGLLCLPVLSLIQGHLPSVHQERSCWEHKLCYQTGPNSNPALPLAS